MPLPRIAVTMGDPAGVGPELCLRAIANAEITAICEPEIYGDVAVLAEVAQRLGLPFARGVAFQPAGEATAGWKPIPQVLDFALLSTHDFTPGRVAANTGAASYAYFEAAIRDALERKVDAICTAPINKEALHAAGIPHPGHTEILAAITKSDRVCMMLTSQEITCSLVTAHVGLHEVPGLLSVAKVLDAIELTAEAMQRLQGRPARLTLCGLNPHAGEGGLFGRREEEQIIAPAAQIARSRGISITDPLPPDTAFLPDRRHQTDAYICMYHDQGLIPMKMLAFDMGVNVTLGLPIIRTSVDHGTAFDIAWQGKASPISMFEAIKLAARLADAKPPRTSGQTSS